MRGSLRPAETVLALVLAGWLAWLFALPPRPAVWLVFATGVAAGAALSWLLARRAGEPWRAFVSRTVDLHLLGAMLAYGLAVQWRDTHGITTDGVTYFAQLRSLLFDRDLQIEPEYHYLGQPTRPGYFVPIGPTPLWLPLYLLVWIVDAAGRALGFWPAPSEPVALGLTLPYVRAALLSSYLAGAAGLAAMLVHLRREFPHASALVTTAVLFGATPLYWYMVYEPSMTHAASFGLVTLLIVLSARWVPRHVTARRAALLGALAALAFLVRPQEALFVLFPGALIVAMPASWGERVRTALYLLRWAAAAALPLVALQLLHAWILSHDNQFALVGQEGGYLDPFHSRWLDTLFSSWHGFLSWTPIVYVAVAGTIFYFSRNRVWALTTLVLLFMMAWVNGSTADWAGGWSFGGRRFTSMLMLLAPGLAFAVEGVRRRPMLVIVPLAAAALWWNHLLMVQYTTGLLPKDAPVPFARLVRQQADLYTRAPYFYPFAFPANVWFAWRTGLPIDRYDLLAGEPLHAAFDLKFDSGVDRFLLDGWAPPTDDGEQCRWIDHPKAELLLPLDLPLDRPIAVEVRARARYTDPPKEATLAVSINDREIGAFKAPPAEPGVARFSIPPSRARVIWKAGYNRLTFETRELVPLAPGTSHATRAADRHSWPVAIYQIRIAPE